MGVSLPCCWALHASSLCSLSFLCFSAHLTPALHHAAEIRAQRTGYHCETVEICLHYCMRNDGVMLKPCIRVQENRFPSLTLAEHPAVTVSDHLEWNSVLTEVNGSFAAELNSPLVTCRGCTWTPWDWLQCCWWHPRAVIYCHSPRLCRRHCCSRLWAVSTQPALAANITTAACGWSLLAVTLPPLPTPPPSPAGGHHAPSALGGTRLSCSSLYLLPLPALLIQIVRS